MTARVVVSALVAAAALAVLSLTAAAAPPCRAGVSSVGPVTIDHGRVSGNFTPTAEVCLR